MGSSSKPQRLDPIFVNTLRSIMQERIEKKLSRPLPKELSMAEGVRTLMKTDGWKMSLQELRTKPKKYEF